MNNGLQRVIGKHALIVAAKGQTELAAQVFVYDQMREVRVDLEKLEVRILMSYDKDYFRVYKVEANEHLPLEKAKELVLGFYNNLLNAAMKLSAEEIENLQTQRKQQFEAMTKAIAEKEVKNSEEQEEGKDEQK